MFEMTNHSPSQPKSIYATWVIHAMTLRCSSKSIFTIVNPAKSTLHEKMRLLQELPLLTQGRDRDRWKPNKILVWIGYIIINRGIQQKRNDLVKGKSPSCPILITSK